MYIVILSRDVTSWRLAGVQYLQTKNLKSPQENNLHSCLSGVTEYIQADALAG